MQRILKDDDSDIVEDVFGWLGSALSLFFNGGPIVQVIHAFQGKRPYQDMNWISLTLNLVNGTLWGAYGLRKEALQVYVCNLTCAGISLIYLCIYLFFVAKKKPGLSIAYMLDAIALTIELFWIFFKLVGEKEVSGYFAMAVNIFIYAAPGIKIFQAISTMDHTLLPIHISILACICSACWLIYGIYLGSFSVCIPNGLGVVFAALQIIVWGIAKSKGKGQNKGKELPTKTSENERKKSDVEGRKLTVESENIQALNINIDRKPEDIKA